MYQNVSKKTKKVPISLHFLKIILYFMQLSVQYSLFDSNFMSTFQMPDIPEDDVQPLRPDIKWTLTMLAIVFRVFIFTIGLFYGFSYLIISNFSLEQEKNFFWEEQILWKEQPFDFTQLSYKVEIPDNINVVVVKSDEINAFASIGWKVMFTTEILKNIKNEEEFLFILWHEISHILNRDPLKGYSFQMPLYATFLFLWIDIWIDANQIQELSSSYMSRQTELQSDRWGVELVKKYNWNVHCILPFFEEDSPLFESFFIYNSTHPTNQARIKQITEMDTRNPLEKNCKEWKYTQL